MDTSNFLLVFNGNYQPNLLHMRVKEINMDSLRSISENSTYGDSYSIYI